MRLFKDTKKDPESIFPLSQGFLVLGSQEIHHGCMFFGIFFFQNTKDMDEFFFEIGRASLGKEC